MLLEELAPSGHDEMCVLLILYEAALAAALAGVSLDELAGWAFRKWGCPACVEMET
jgi:hypothetical protein